MSSRPSYDQLAALVVGQAQTIRRLETEVSELRGEVAELKRRVGQNSRNSSRPPSSDGLSKPAVVVKKSLRGPSGREPGGQSGHPGSHLRMVACPGEVVDHVPEVCAGCGRELCDGEDLGFIARQVFDLPEVRLRSVEHRAHRRRCACGRETTPVFPVGVGAPAQYGPRLRALVVYLVSYQHLPYKRASTLLRDWFGVSVSSGTLAAMVARAGNDLGAFVDEIERQVISSPVAHLDETGGRVQGKLRWLFAASTTRLTSFSLHERRGKDGIDHHGILQAFGGVAVHDGFKPYQRYHNASHALCNAHHLRELQAVIEQDQNGSQSWAQEMAGLLRSLHHAVQAARENGQQQLDPAQLVGARIAYGLIIMLGYHQNPENTVRTGKRGRIGQSVARNLLARLDTQREEVLRFTSDFRVPFDNNLVERDIRMIKIQQKISGCWRTVAGAENFLKVRSYLSTAAKQQQPILDALDALAIHDPWIPAAAGP